MRTLDEVIEIASDWTNGFDEMSIEKQMLHYLKEYKNTDENYKKAIAHVTEVIDHYEKMVADYPSVNNPALDWDELKQMKGKPVWIEDNIDEPEDTTKYWAIYRRIEKAQETEYALLSDFFYDKAEYGKSWKAYRKERS